MSKTNSNNGFFNELENTRPFLKMAFEGFAGTGKTFTSALLAIGLHNKIKSDKPIVWYDTEKALKALKPFFDKAGIKILTRESRSLADLVTTIDLCEKGQADILIIDSITHVWEAYLEAFRNEKKRTFLQFQDWGIIKPKWKKEFSDKLVLSHLHIIFTGRAGYEYDQEINEDTGKKELIKTGIKMKVENETEYEPDIVVLMEKIKDMDGGKMSIKRSAQVIKDRTTIIDGHVFFNPSFKDFEPAINVLLTGIASESNLDETKDTFKAYEEEYDTKKTERKVALEEIEGILTQLVPGQSKEEKKMKMDLLEKLFNTRSWTSIEKTDLKVLQEKVEMLKEFKINAVNYVKECSSQGIPVDYAELMKLLEEEMFDVNNPLNL